MMKLEQILDIFDLTYVIIYFDTTPEDGAPEWEGWALDVPWWIADSNIANHGDYDNRVYYDPDQDNPNKRTGLVLIVKEPD